MKASSKMAIAFLLNLSFSIIEFIYGMAFNSSAILADAVHDLGDAVAIGFSTFFEFVSNRKQDANYSFGYKRFSLLGALVTSLILVSGSFLVIIRNIGRLFNPETVNYDGMLVLGIVAIIINYLAARIVSHGETRNESILSLHFLEDILGWLAVIIVSIIMRYTHWFILDPIFAIGIAVYILSQALPKLFETIRLFLEAVPEDFDYQSVGRQIEALPNVAKLMQFNVWSLDGIETIANLHVCLEDHNKQSESKHTIYNLLKVEGIHTATIEIDEDEAEHAQHSRLNQAKTHHHHHH